MEAELQAQEAIDLMYLKNKRTILANPGTKISSYYYSAMNTTVELSEMTFNNGRLQISLSQLNFNSQSQLVIPNSSYLSECYLHLELPPILPNQCLCRGWGYAAISNLSFLFGSSNISLLTINGQTMFQMIMLQCETSEKKSAVLQLAGQEQLGPTVGNVKADILLPFPWSSMCGLHHKKGFETDLLNNPITIQIQFGPRSNIYGGAGYNGPTNPAPGINYPGTSIPFPSAFTMATAYFRQGDYTYKDTSLKPILARNPGLMYSYPFIHAQSLTPSQFTGIPAPAPYAGVPSSRVQVPLLSFINADLVSISFGLIQTQYLTSTNNNPALPLNYEPMYNISLLFNGLTMYEAPGTSSNLYCIMSEPGACQIENSFINPGTTSPFSMKPINSFVTVVDFSQKRAICYDSEFYNVWRIGNNTLSLSFNTMTQNTYQLFCTYYYNAVCEVQHENANIYFD
jgi:hypothetical protein